jgi:hypothetical protein
VDGNGMTSYESGDGIAKLYQNQDFRGLFIKHGCEKVLNDYYNVLVNSFEYMANISTIMKSQNIPRWEDNKWYKCSINNKQIYTFWF